MKNILKIKSLFAAGVLSLTLFGAVFVPASVSALGCNGSSCNGRDPAATGCNQNAYIASRTQFLNTSNGAGIGQVYMDIYYSPACGTNWVRVTSNPYGGVAHKVISVAQTNGFNEVEDDRTNGASYSMMVYAPGSTPVQAYATLKDTAGNTRAYTPDVLVY